MGDNNSGRGAIEYCLYGVIAWAVLSILFMYGFHELYVSHKNQTTQSVIVVLAITVSSGIWGGIGSYSLIYLNRKHYEYNGLVSESEVNLIDEINPYIFLGVISSNLVPLFLSLVSQGDINVFIPLKAEVDNESQVLSMDWVRFYSLVGLCLIASVYSKNFIVKIGNKTLLDKMNEIKASNNSLDTKTDTLSKKLIQTQVDLQKEQSKVLYLKAYHLFKRFLDLKRSMLKLTIEPLEISLNTKIPDSVSTENIRKMKICLEKAIHYLDDSINIIYDVDSVILKGNCYRQMNIITNDDNFLKKAFDCLNEIRERCKDPDEITDYNENDIICIYINLICYAINLNRSEDIITSLTKEAISVTNRAEFIKQLKEDVEIIDYMDLHDSYKKMISSYS